MNNLWTRDDVRRLRELADWVERAGLQDSQRNPADDRLFGWKGDEEGETSERVALLALAREEYAHRETRRQVLPNELLGEPAWDMMLDLFINGEVGKPVSVTSACLASRVPATTGLRWLSVLERKGLVERRPDPSDNRRYWAALTPMGLQKMEELLRKRLASRQGAVPVPARIVKLIRPQA